MPEDRILALGDQGILRQSVKEKGLILYELLNEPIDDPEVFGPLINQFLSTLYTLKTRPTPCEILLYLSGHGLEPGNIILIPDTLYAHPARKDLKLEPVETWYTSNKDEQKYMVDFYKECMGVCESSLRGFVGGELYAHQRGYVGILGVLGLWSYYTKDCPSSVTHHLFIVADTCFAGIWGQTLQKIAENCILKELVTKHPVSIQCATGEFETSCGGVFTPLWYYLNTAIETEVRSLREQYEQQDAHAHDLDNDDDEIQHPCFFTTSRDPPSWNVYRESDANFFVYLHKRMQQKVIANKPLLCSYTIALDYVTEYTKDLHKKEVSKMEQAKKGNLTEIEQRARKNIESILEKVPQSVLEWPFNIDARRFRSHKFGRGDNLAEEEIRELREGLPACDKKDKLKVNAGVYVFQGGKGDMSLIVAPVRGGKDEEVILVDGGHVDKYFVAAWNAKLKHLKKITCIVVTHHDHDHTNGIDLLLQRYCAEGFVAKRSTLPDLTNAVIYMNKREDFRTQRNFKHEKWISESAKELNIVVEDMILPCGSSHKHIIDTDTIAVYGLLPTRDLVDEFMDKVPEVGNSTKPVPSRGGTTATNVLSINLAAVWKGTHAYLFTGDAHLKDVTKAAEQFLSKYHPKLEKFEYVDVPHHGSWPSNGEDVEETMRGLARIPSENYLLSHNGCNKTPSPDTVKEILKSDKCKTLHFLYEKRSNKAKDVQECRTCGTGSCMTTWKCCIKDGDGRHIGTRLNEKIDTKLDATKIFKFFPFQD